MILLNIQTPLVRKDVERRDPLSSESHGPPRLNPLGGGGAVPAGNSLEISEAAYSKCCVEAVLGKPEAGWDLKHKNNLHFES